jgi:hypothetical protein
MYRSLLAAAAPVLLAIASIACNGQVDGGDGTGSTTSRSQAGAEQQEAAKRKAVAAPPSSTSGNTGGAVTTDPACSYEYGSSSGGSSGTGVFHFMCESVQHYTCGAAAREITVSCETEDGEWGQGTLSCNGHTYPFDCASGCSLNAAEYAKCNLPEPDASSSGGGSSSSSSSSSGG